LKTKFEKSNICSLFVFALSIQPETPCGPIQFLPLIFSTPAKQAVRPIDLLA
jgi:hypothetical protein